MRDKPIKEIVLRKYEAPSENFDRNLRIFLLSLGIIRPGSFNTLAEKVFKLILEGEKSIDELSTRTGASKNAVRYVLRKLKALGLIEGRKTYRIAEGNLRTAVKLLRFKIDEILQRIEEYAEKLSH